MEDFNHFNTLANNLDGTLGKIIRKTAFDGRANVQAEIRSWGLIDTGFMINSVYVVTNEESTYGEAQPTKPGAYLLPELDQPEEATEAYIGIGANYAIYPNYGTVDQPAKPFFEPGIDKTRDSFETAISAFESMLRDANHE